LRFEGGSVWEGTVELTPANLRTTSSGPAFVIGSYGQGPATIRSGDQIAIYAQSVAAIHIEDLNLIGNGPARAIFGLAFQNTTAALLENIRIQRVQIQGYAHAIDLRAGTPPAGYRKIVLEDVVAHGNASGPNLVGYSDRPASTHGYQYGLQDVEIINCHFYGNTGFGQAQQGAGVHVWNVDRLSIRGSKIHDNGGDNPGIAPSYDGPSAILVYDARDAIIERNEIFHQRYHPKTPADAAGIDVWGERTTIQYNFIHSNEGPAINIASDSPEEAMRFFGLSRGVTIRYNMLANNGLPLPRNAPAPAVVGMQIHLFGPVKDFEIYNNTMFVRARVSDPAADNVYGMIFLTDTGSGPYERIHVRNNVFAVDGNAPFLQVQWIAPFTDVRFENNAYLTSARDQLVRWGFVPYRSIAEWVRDTGQEQVGRTGSARVGPIVWLCGAATGQMPSSVSAELLRTMPGSPLRDGGLTLRNPPYSLEVGEHDFFGARVPQGEGFDIGAHEADTIQSCSASSLVNRR